MQFIQKNLKAQEFNLDANSDSGRPVMCRLDNMLQLKTVKMDEFKNIKATSVLSSVLGEAIYRDPLLQIGELSKDFTLCRVFDD